MSAEVIRCRPSPRLTAVVVSVWLAALSGVIASPYLAGSPTSGDELTRRTADLAMAGYFTAAAMMLFLSPADRTAVTTRGQLTRLVWTLSGATFLVHVGMAFHYFHGWSHADAVRHTEVVSGFGAGVYVSYLFTLAWGADVLSWWVAPRAFAARPPWVGRWLHGFMLFMVFNATVVYEVGLVRWAGLALCLALAGLWAVRRAVPLASGAGADSMAA